MLRHQIEPFIQLIHVAQCIEAEALAGQTIQKPQLALILPFFPLVLLADRVIKLTRQAQSDPLKVVMVLLLPAG